MGLQIVVLIIGRWKSRLPVGGVSTTFITGTTAVNLDLDPSEMEPAVGDRSTLTRSWETTL